MLSSDSSHTKWIIVPLLRTLPFALWLLVWNEPTLPATDFKLHHTVDERPPNRSGSAILSQSVTTKTKAAGSGAIIDLSESKKIEKIIAKPLNRVRKIAAELEIRRSIFRQVELPDGTNVVQVTISPPTLTEIEAYRAAVVEELRVLPKDTQPYMLVDAQRWQDQLLKLGSNSRVVYIRRGYKPNGGEDVRYWEFETATPNEFTLGANGVPGIPENYHLGNGERWFGKDYHPPQRLAHLLRIE